MSSLRLLLDALDAVRLQPEAYLIAHEDPDYAAVANCMTGLLLIDFTGGSLKHARAAARPEVAGERGWPALPEPFWRAMRLQSMDEASRIDEALAVEVHTLRRLSLPRLDPLIGAVEAVRRKPETTLLVRPVRTWNDPANFHAGVEAALMAYLKESTRKRYRASQRAVQIERGWAMDSAYSPWTNMARGDWDRFQILREAMAIAIISLRDVFKK